MLRLSLLQNLFKGLQEVLPKDRNVCKYVKGTVQTMQADVKKYDDMDDFDDDGLYIYLYMRKIHLVSTFNKIAIIPLIRKRH